MGNQSLAVQMDEEGGNAVINFRAQLEKRAAEFKMVLPSHITAEKFQRTVLTAIQADPELLAADRRSLLTSCMKAAQDGLLPDKREAALIVFKTRQQIDGQWQTVKLVSYMPMVYGLRKKILQSGEVRDIHASVIYRQEIEAGLFVYEEGTERMLRHKPLLDPGFEPTDDDIAAAYSVATLTDGSMVFEVMRRADINKVRQASQTGALFDRNGKPREPSGPWVDWFAEMAKKTVVRRHSKTLPMSGDIVDVEAMDAAIAARSAMAALDSREPDAPEPIPPMRDAAAQIDHDPETGEVPREGETEPNKASKSKTKTVEIAPTFDEAASTITACKTSDEVNAELGKLRPHFSGDDLDDLNMVGATRINDLLKQGEAAKVDA